MRMLSSHKLGACLLFFMLSACGTSGTQGTGVAARTESGVQIPNSSLKDETDLRRRARLRFELGTSYYRQRQYAIALEELRQAVAIDPSYPDLYAVLGLVFMDLGDKRQAEETFRKGISIEPLHSDVNLNYGWFLCQNGREKESIDHFVVVARNPLYEAPVKPLQNAGICAIRMGDKKLGEQFLLVGYDTDPNSPVVLYNLALLNLQKSELVKARFYMTRLHTLYEPNAQTLWLDIKIERQAGNREKFNQLTDQLKDKFPVSPEADALRRGAYDE